MTGHHMPSTIVVPGRHFSLRRHTFFTSQGPRSLAHSVGQIQSFSDLTYFKGLTFGRGYDQNMDSRPEIVEIEMNAISGSLKVKDVSLEDSDTFRDQFQKNPETLLLLLLKSTNWTLKNSGIRQGPRRSKVQGFL